MDSTDQPEDAFGILMIKASLDVIEAVEFRQSLLASISATAGEQAARKVELSDESATAPALQLAVATARTLEKQGRFAGFGPMAEATLGNLG